MSRVYKYLDKLEKDKQLLVDILNSKNITSSSNETFSTLVPKVSSMDDLNKYYDLTKKTSGNFRTYVTQILFIDTSEYTSMYAMFEGYSSIKTIPQLDTSNVTSMNSMFSGCSSLITIPLLDTSKVKSCNAMFMKCKSLKTIPQLDTSKVTDMSMMFNNCTSLETIPLLDTSNVTNMNNTFNTCSSLTTIPQLDTSKVTDMYATFNSCLLLTTIPQLNASNVNRIYSVFNNCYNLTTIGGFTNLGQSYDTTKSANYSDYTLNLSYSNNLTHDSLMNVINNLYDIATKGCKPQKLRLGPNLSKLTEEEIAIATNKGWTVS